MNRRDAQPVGGAVRPWWALSRGLALVVALLACGCAPQVDGPARRTAGQDASRPAAGRPVEPAVEASSDDPCAARLHDICGVLLLHVLTEGDLPATLEELGPGPGVGTLPPLVCPASNRPYVYNPFGIYMPEQRARLVVYDPEPAHRGMRWGIVAVEATETDPLICKVIALPESFFVLRPPR